MFCEDLLIDKNNFYYNMVEMACNILKFEDLPETIPARILVFNCLFMPHFVFFEKDGKVWVWHGGFSGKLDPYGYGDHYLFTNAELGTFELEWKEDKDCVVVWTNTSGTPFFKLAQFERYSELMEEEYKSLKVGLINTRITRLFHSDNEREKQSMETALNQSLEGKPTVYMKKNAYGIDKTNTESMAIDDGKTLNELRETIIFTNGMFLNGIGLASQLYEKKERLISSEAGNEYPSLKVNITDMLEYIKDGIERANKRFGLDMKVSLNPLWYPQSQVEPIINEEGEVEVVPVQEEAVEETVDKKEETIDNEVKETETDNKEEKKESDE